MSFLDREVTYGETTFYIGKLLPMDSYTIFLNHILPVIGKVLGSNADSDFGLSVIPQKHYKPIVAELRKHITFTSANQMTPAKVAGDEELAFRGLEPAHILLLETRAFAVNFSGSWDVLHSEFPRLEGMFTQLQRLISNPSSLTPSGLDLSRLTGSNHAESTETPT